MVGKVQIGGTASAMMARPRRKAGGPKENIPIRTMAATDAARSFLAWLREHELCRAWTVDDVWYLAEADFAEALGIPLPPRRVFLGELQKLAGVCTSYDRRLYDRAGRVRCKTTFYSFTPSDDAPSGWTLAA